MSICLPCLGDPDGHCPQHPAGVKAKPVESGLLDRCPTCGGRVLVVQDEEGTAHYLPLWAEGAERLLRLILQGDEQIQDWDELEDNGLRRSQISAALSAALSGDEAKDCAEFVGRTAHEP